MVSVSSATTFVRTVAGEVKSKNVTFLAGSIAYSAFVSMVPLLLFVMLGIAFFAPNLQADVLELATTNVSPVLEDFLRQMFESQSGDAAGSSVLGFLLLVWGALKIFRGLDTAFSEIYETDTQNSLPSQVRDGLIVLVSLVLSVAAIIVGTSVFGTFAGRIPYLGVAVPLVLSAGLVLAFLPMYYVFPNTDVSVREVLPGVFVAAFGWALLQGLFQLYVVLAMGGSPTDLVTGIMLLLTWLYFCGVVLLVGVVVNAVYGGYAGRTPGSARATTTAD
ncbi:YihY/virulence factor BrkB family protein [Haloarchaeobius sp. DFWS5]|uniref:YihY/virulence factor BrkB family protein n=1 Tax=Haloarchaeobius sp. DFWS5 TaxID=3446114 RepID=UPI003EBE00FF